MTALGIHGRDIGELLAPQGERRQALPGFDSDYVDIVDYIIRCTHRIWEQKDVGLIATHYAADIVIHTMAGPITGVAGVIANTARTLAAFPDRTLIGEAVIWSNEGRSAGGNAYYSSHRITSRATNTGPSEFGPATGRSTVFTTIADCVCRANLIVEEWLVRDNSALVRDLGFDPVTVACVPVASEPAAWRMAAMAAISDLSPTPFPNGALPPAHEAEAFAAAVFDRIIGHRRFGTVRAVYSSAAQWAGPGARRLFGWGEITGWYVALIATFGDLTLRIDHVAAVDDEIAVRWSATGTHDGCALYGAPTHRPVYLLGVTHWRIAAGVIVEEHVVFDEIALLRQIAGGQ